MEFEYGADDDKHVVRDIQSIVISILLEMPVMKVNFVLIAIPFIIWPEYTQMIIQILCKVFAWYEFPEITIKFLV